MKTTILVLFAVASFGASITPAPAADGAADELQPLENKINAKLQAGKTSAADLADELKALDALIAKHKDDKSDDAAVLLYTKVALYREILHDPAKSDAAMEQLKRDYPNSPFVKKVEPGSGDMQNAAAYPVGSQFPDFTAPDVTGKSVSLSGCKGKVVLIDFWATWCGPCVGEIPNVIKIHDKHQADNFALISISLDQEKSKLESFVKEKKMAWPQIFDADNGDKQLASKLGIEYIPMTFVLDGDGRILAKDLRGDELEAAIAKALAKKQRDFFMARVFKRCFLLAVCFGLVISPGRGSEPAHDYPIQPVPFTAVHLEDTFWLPRLETNRLVTIPFALQKNEETGRNDNFRIAAHLKAGKYKGERYNDTDVYKVIEGASYSLAQHPDPALEKQVDALIVMIAAAQEPDGYLFTARTCDSNNPAPGTGPERWADEATSHELYDMGHMQEAAVAYFQATGKRKFLEVAIKNADLLNRTFGPGPDKRAGTSGHQEIELALVKLYRATGEERYLKLAKYFLDARGKVDGFLKHYPEGSRWAMYNDPVQIQVHLPILEQTEAVGHAVRAGYMYCGMADVAALTGDQDYARAIDRLWDDVAGRKQYFTGGVGARHQGESFGAAYLLPNDTAYNETCAAIANVFWNERLFLLHGDGKYVDMLERTAYNGIISGVSLSGDRFFYSNPLASDGKFRFNQGAATRSPWFNVACCPGNLTRFLPSFPGFVYARKGDTLMVNLFVASRAEFELAGHKLSVRQETRYPWDGDVKLTLEPESAGEFTVALRIPGWSSGQGTPGELYRFSSANVTSPTIKVNGQPAEMKLDHGYGQLRRAWKRGDTIELQMAMPVLRAQANDQVAADRGRVALQRGPLVYCAEGVDQPGGKVSNLELISTADYKAEWRGDLLDGVMVIKGQVSADEELQGPASGAHMQEFTAIPYCTWANRGQGEMAVWLKQAAVPAK